MYKGTVKKIVRDRGFGFIKAEDGREIFFHRNSLQTRAGFEELQMGQAAEFEIEKSYKGSQAVNINLI